jgi:putative endonuclease
MPYVVYIIQSQVDGTCYKGYSEDPQLRLERHNRGESTYTRRKAPWKLVYVVAFETKREALIREKAQKKYSHDQIRQLLLSRENIVGRFS